MSCKNKIVSIFVWAIVTIIPVVGYMEFDGRYGLISVIISAIIFNIFITCLVNKK